MQKIILDFLDFHETQEITNSQVEISSKELDKMKFSNQYPRITKRVKTAHSFFFIILLQNVSHLWAFWTFINNRSFLTCCITFCTDTITWEETFDLCIDAV